MYRVIKSDNTTELLSQLQYVYKQKNGVIVRCDKDKAQGIISKDNSTIYSFNDTPLSNSYEMVSVEEIDNVEFMLQQQTNIELALVELYELMGGSE